MKIGKLFSAAGTVIWPILSLSAVAIALNIGQVCLSDYRDS